MYGNGVIRKYVVDTGIVTTAASEYQQLLWQIFCLLSRAYCPGHCGVITMTGPPALMLSAQLCQS